MVSVLLNPSGRQRGILLKEVDERARLLASIDSWLGRLQSTSPKGRIELFAFFYLFTKTVAISVADLTQFKTFSRKIVKLWKALSRSTGVEDRHS
jgi:hypothetical protein